MVRFTGSFFGEKDSIGASQGGGVDEVDDVDGVPTGLQRMSSRRSRPGSPQGGDKARTEEALALTNCELGFITWADICILASDYPQLIARLTAAVELRAVSESQRCQNHSPPIETQERPLSSTTPVEGTSHPDIQPVASVTEPKSEPQPALKMASKSIHQRSAQMWRKAGIAAHMSRCEAISIHVMYVPHAACK